MNKNPIGIIDSGIGGLSIWQEIVREIPNESTVYVADSKNCPYGSKSSKEIYKLSRKLINFLLGKKAKIIVIACNTITVACLKKLREDFSNVPIIGTVPVVKTASELTKNGRIGVLSTKQTAVSKYQNALIKKYTKGLKVLNLGTDKLVTIVEKGENDSLKINKILRQELKPFIDFKIDTLVLGCSHFPFLNKEIGQILGKNVQVLDSSGAIARQANRILIMNIAVSGYNKPGYIFYSTGYTRKINEIPKWEKVIL